MKYHTFFFRKLGKMSQDLLSVAVMIGALRVKEIEYNLLKQYLKLVLYIFILILNSYLSQWGVSLNAHQYTTKM